MKETLEHIEPAEVEYHRKTWQKVSQAQAMVEHWMSHLAEKYRLKQGDRVTEDGYIVRQEELEIPDPKIST